MAASLVSMSVAIRSSDKDEFWGTKIVIRSDTATVCQIIKSAPISNAAQVAEIHGVWLVSVGADAMTIWNTIRVDQIE